MTESKEPEFDNDSLELENKMSKQGLRMARLAKKIRKTEQMHGDIGIAPKKKNQED